MCASILEHPVKKCPSSALPLQGLLSAIVDSSEDAIVSITLEGTITSWNESAERLFGYSKEDAVGKNISFLVPPELEEEQRDITMRVQAGERVSHYETVRIGKNGKYVDINLTISPVRDAAEQITGASMIGQDIAARKILEATCDKTRIIEVFRNLITNAVKYNDKKEPLIEVGFLEDVETPQGREENVFYIKDNGIGIEPKYHQLIFTMFKKAPSPAQDKKSGSGVGLAFAKKIIERHNGRIWLESEPGKGSTFYFTLNQKDALHGR